MRLPALLVARRRTSTTTSCSRTVCSFSIRKACRRSKRYATEVFLTGAARRLSSFSRTWHQVDDGVVAVVVDFGLLLDQLLKDPVERRNVPIQRALPRREVPQCQSFPH